MLGNGATWMGSPKWLGNREKVLSSREGKFQQILKPGLELQEPWFPHFWFFSPDLCLQYATLLRDHSSNLPQHPKLIILDPYQSLGICFALPHGSALPASACPRPLTLTNSFRYSAPGSLMYHPTPTSGHTHSPGHPAPVCLSYLQYYQLFRNALHPVSELSKLLNAVGLLIDLVANAAELLTDLVGEGWRALEMVMCLAYSGACFSSRSPGLGSQSFYYGQSLPCFPRERFLTGSLGY